MSGGGNSASSANTSADATSGSNSNRSQQSSTSAASWMNGTFSVSISTPVEDLNIQFPSIQLPSGISSLFGELAARQHQQQQLHSNNHQQITASNGDGDSSTTAALPLTTTSGSSSSAALQQNGVIGGNSSNSSATSSSSTDTTMKGNNKLATVTPSASITDIGQHLGSARANSSPATMSKSNATAGKGRANTAAASSSYIIPMNSECGNDVGGGGGGAERGGSGGVWQRQIIVSGGGKEKLTTAAPPSQMVVDNENDDVLGANGCCSTTPGAPQQRRRRHNNSVRASQSADRLSRTARRASRPRNTTTTRRHTQSVASFVAAAAAAAANATASSQSGSSGSTSASANNNNSRNTNTSTANNRGSVITTSTDSSSTSSGSTENGSGSDENANNLRSLRRHLRTLFGMRHMVFRQIIEQFPSLYMFGSLFCALFVLLVVLMHFFVSQMVTAFALALSVAHFSDSFSFKRLVTGGQPSGWLIAAKILFRQFMIGTVLGQTQWVLPSLLFQPQQQQPQQTPTTPTMQEAEDGIGTLLPLSTVSATAFSSPTFSSTLYITILAQFFVMDLLLLIKLGVSSLPSSWLGASTKRRIYQWIEYSCALYRFALPFLPWNDYFNAVWWTVMYGGIKLLFALALIWAWLLATLRFFRSTHIGSLASEAECGQGEQCTICFSDFRVPIKLKCSHIFCTECIRTWLDREVTCPICRAVVTREDNHYRNGESMPPCVF